MLVSIEKPLHFKHKLDVVSIYHRFNNKLLWLQRRSGKWGAMAGKVEKGEKFSKAATREAKEELGLVISESQLEFIQTLHIQREDLAYRYHMYLLDHQKEPKIILNDEHHQFLWLTPYEIYSYNNIYAANESLKYVINHAKNSLKSKIIMN